VIDFGIGDIDERLIAIDIQTGDGAEGLAMLMLDGKTVAEDGGVGGAGGERGGQGEESEWERFFHDNAIMLDRAERLERG
jgi:hypothetical protein